MYLQLLVNTIINTYFLNKQCIVLISNNDLLINSISPIVTIKSTIINSVDTFDRMLLDSLNFGCDCYIINTNQLNITRRFMERFDLNVQLAWQRNGLRQFLYIFDDPMNDNDAIVTEMFLMNKILKNIPDLLVISRVISNNDSGIDSSRTHLGMNDDLFYEIYNENETNIVYKLITRWIHNPEPVVLDYWHSINQSFTFNNDLFPDKVLNMHGLQLDLTVVYYPPYDILKDNVIVYPYKQPDVLVEGIELRVLREYANRYNVTLNLTLGEELWGDIYENRTGFGLFGDIVENKIDLGVGAIGTWSNINPYMDSSYPFVRTGVTCLVPVPRLLNKFSIPVLPFADNLWALVIFTLITLIFSFNFISRITEKMNFEKVLNCKQLAFQGLSESTYIMYGMFLLQPLPETAEYRNLSFRNLLTWILLQNLLISTAYNSGLSAIMTLPRYEKAIKTVQDLVESDLEWGANDEAWIYSISGSTQPHIRKLIDNFRVYDDETLEKIAPLRKYAYSIERLPAGSYAIGGYVTEKTVMGLQSMTEDIYWEQCGAVFRKSSPFLPRFNHLVFQLKDSGLLYAYEKQVALYYLNFFVQLRVTITRNGDDHGSDNDEPVILRIDDLQGVFTFLLFGLSVSIIVFIMEILYYHKQKDKINLLGHY